MQSIDVPQANNLSTVRRAVEAVAAGCETITAVADWTHYSLRHAGYRVHAARVLGLLSLSDPRDDSTGDQSGDERGGGPIKRQEQVIALTVRGHRLLQTESETAAERIVLHDAIIHSPALRPIVEDLMPPAAPTQEELAAVLTERAGLRANTAIRRAGGLLTWRRRVLLEPPPEPAPPPEPEPEPEAPPGPPTIQLSLFE